MGASSRLRLLQYLKTISSDEVNFDVNYLINDSSLNYRYLHGYYSFFNLIFAYIRRFFLLLLSRNYNLIVIEKEAFPWAPYFFERIAIKGRKYVLDYDDAVFHNYDQHKNALLKFLFKNKLKKLIEKSSIVLCGSSYLASYASSSGSKHVEMLPTVIDLVRYNLDELPVKDDVNLPILCWIGSPSTVKYLNLISDSLRRLSVHTPFVLRIIGAKLFIPGIQIECFDWSESDEVRLISECDVGIMPLALTNWELGKCGYKLIQYMACCLPVVATDFGTNSEIIQHGHNGFLVGKDDEWELSLFELLNDAQLRQRMGQSGRATVEVKYSIQVTGSKMSELLKSAAKDI